MGGVQSEGGSTRQALGLIRRIKNYRDREGDFKGKEGCDQSHHQYGEKAQRLQWGHHRGYWIQGVGLEQGGNLFIRENPRHPVLLHK